MTFFLVKERRRESWEMNDLKWGQTLKTSMVDDDSATDVSAPKFKINEMEIHEIVIHTYH